MSRRSKPRYIDPLDWPELTPEDRKFIKDQRADLRARKAEAKKHAEFWERAGRNLAYQNAVRDGRLPPPSQPQQQPQEDGWAVRRAKELMAAVCPNWRTMGPGAVRAACAEEAERRDVKLPGPDSFSRAMGRRPHK
jgi:hypothetical protein